MREVDHFLVNRLVYERPELLLLSFGMNPQSICSPRDSFIIEGKCLSLLIDGGGNGPWVDLLFHCALIRG